ncbi:MAG: aspartate/glutamate racemase family protein [Anaerovoracaceae bacterium]
MIKIAYLDPVPEDAGISVFLDELRRYAAPDTDVSYHTLKTGADNYEYEVYEACMVPYILKKVKELEEEGYDGVILGCFYDPALEAARELCENMVVTGAAQGAVTLAALLSKRFSLMIPRDKNYTHMKEMVEKNGMLHKLASIRVLNIRVLDLQDSDVTDRRMEEEMEAAIREDHAEAMVLACTMEVGKYRQLQEQFGIPVIDPAVAGLKLTEYLIRCRKDCGWYTSKLGTYETPPEEELASFRFF